ncbi:MAG TPA: aldehyde dehydrogenase family protein [Tepidisphaeraceae bacterium]|nr:aldehyde dehydrogenase family protein [Tepidisphaeraceae bacterium]
MELNVTNPFDASVIARVPLADEAAIDSTISRAHEAFSQTRQSAPFERAKILLAVAEAIRARRDEFAGLIVAEAGKPITLAEAEVDRAVITFTSAAEEARQWDGEMLSLDGFATGKGHFGWVRRFPIGVIYGITPFNFPLNLVAHKVAPAIATGNTIVIKPSPRTPLSALKLVEVIEKAGCPRGQVSAVVCPNELAAHPISDSRIKHVSFTGSAAVGWKIKQQSGEKRVTLELGGNAALIVHDDADLSSVVAAASTGAFGYAGQSCISVQRMLVHENVYEKFRESLTQYVKEKVRTGDPRDRSVMVGPLIDKAAMQRVRGAIDDAVRGGARIVFGGEMNGPCLNPTVLENVNSQMAVCATEIFAPVATLQRYRDFDQAIAMANDSVYGLQAGVFTRDIGRAWKAFETLDVGGVMINQAPTWRVETMPYGGIKQSGLGREGVRYAMQDMTEPRTLVMRIE